MDFLLTKPNKDITSTTLDDFYLNSNYPLLKVHSSGTFSFNSAFGMKTISHDLGYIPFAIVFSQIIPLGGGAASEGYYQHDLFVLGATAQYWAYTQIFANRLDIFVGATDDVGNQVSGFYYIFKEQII